jgi:hypothetical protein
MVRGLIVGGAVISGLAAVLLVIWVIRTEGDRSRTTPSDRRWRREAGLRR